MDRSEVMDLINEIEEKFPVDTWVVDDIHVWPLIRIPLAMSLYKEDMGSHGDNNTKPLFKKIAPKISGIFSSLKAFILDREHNESYKRKADVVFLSNSICRTKFNGGW